MDESKNVTFYMITEEQINQMIERAFERFVSKSGDPFAEKTICSKSEAARRLGKHRASIYNMIADGRLKTTPDGKEILVSSVIEYEIGKTNEDEKSVKINKRGHKVYV